MERPNNPVLTISVGIIAFKRYGPVEKAKSLQPPVPQNQLPALRSSSDMMWALWEKDVLLNVHLEDRGNINFFMSLSIENEDTLRILRRAFNQVNSDLTRVGRIFDMTTEEGRAILGRLHWP